MVYLVRHRQPVFPEDLVPNRFGLVALGGELTVDTLLEAYRKGIFPWSGEHPIPWYSPDPRLILEPRQVHLSRSLAKSFRRGRYTVRFDSSFMKTMEGCATTPRPGQNGTWISGNMFEAYGRLFDRGIAHSVEAWHGEQLVGGLYGLALGRAFFGESMFARAPDASKMALVSLCQRLEAWDFEFVDCQQVTEHLIRMGAKPISRLQYLTRLRRALESPSRSGSWADLECPGGGRDRSVTGQ